MNIFLRKKQIFLINNSAVVTYVKIQLSGKKVIDVNKEDILYEIRVVEGGTQWAANVYFSL